MLGGITGDIVGSVYEFDNIKTTEFPLFRDDCRFTDDTILTVALAETILRDRDYTERLKHYYQKYPFGGYGGFFSAWARSDDSKPYNSWGNGAAMRIGPVGFAFDSLDEVLANAKKYTEITHNHPEGICGAQATASAIFLARTGSSKDKIREYISENFGYNLNRTCDEIRPTYEFNESCRKTVPEAIIAFLDSHDFESAIRIAVSLGGDSDTLACITGSIAEAYYGGVPEPIAVQALSFLDEHLRGITNEFAGKFRRQ